MGFIEIVSEDERNIFELDDSRIIYRRFDSEVYHQIHKKHTKDRGFNKNTGGRKQETDDKAVNDALLDWIIVDWENIKHPTQKEEDGGPVFLPCIMEWKKKLPPSIKMQIINAADAETSDQEVTESEKKTSENTQHTSGTARKDPEEKKKSPRP